jgi:hypothetical protein
MVTPDSAAEDAGRVVSTSCQVWLMLTGTWGLGRLRKYRYFGEDKYRTALTRNTGPQLPL